MSEPMSAERLSMVEELIRDGIEEIAPEWVAELLAEVRRLQALVQDLEKEARVREIAVSALEAKWENAAHDWRDEAERERQRAEAAEACTAPTAEERISELEAALRPFAELTADNEEHIWDYVRRAKEVLDGAHNDAKLKG